MKYNPDIHHRKAMRLRDFDYSSPGAYFITICTQNRAHLFGKIQNHEMILNDAGEMVRKWYFETGNKYKNIQCCEFVIMPNHFHCIIEIYPDVVGTPDIVGTSGVIGTSGIIGTSDIVGTPDVVGTPLRGCPFVNGHVTYTDIGDAHAGASLRASSVRGASVFDIVGWFKTMTTNEYIRGVKNGNWMPFDKRVWQMRYWDHVVRNVDEYERIRLYIKNNPLKWGIDKLNDAGDGYIAEASVGYNEEVWMV